MNRKYFFLNRLAQTSPAPPALEVNSARGIYLYGNGRKKYIDLISGISVSNLGHANSAIGKAIRRQLDQHSYVMVYGEYVLSPQVNLAKALTEYLPARLDNVYFVNSGAEAIEGAMKLAKRHTGRTEIISFRNSYHGSTQGALSIVGGEELKRNFRPLIPDTRILHYGSEEELKFITHRTAAVFAEPVQAEAGVVQPGKGFLKALRKRCDEVGALLALDEIQTGMRRTGPLFAFEEAGAVPDILCLGKALGGGMPLGAFISSKRIMSDLSHDPVLGHLTTFGGHPLSCAAGLAALKQVSRLRSGSIRRKGDLFRSLLKHKRIKEVRGAGLLLALQFSSEKENKAIIQRCMDQGVLTDWFLFNPSAMRIAPPLIISEREIRESCRIILGCLQ